MDLEVRYADKWERQPCHFGEYGALLFWTKDYQAKEIAHQIYALLMGWA